MYLMEGVYIMTREEFGEIFNLLLLNYNKKLDDAIIDIWYNEYKDMSKENFKKCVLNYIKTKKKFPYILPFILA